MRLLDTTMFELRTDSPEFFKSEGYAILSHRWNGAEITFDEIARHASDLRKAGDRRMKSPQLDKIRGACETARKIGFRWLWIDNCCINKSSATEESESINSMFKWYRDARVCVSYLSDVKLGFSSGPPSYEAAQHMEHKSTEKTQTDMLRSVNYGGPSEWFSRGWTLQELLAPQQMYFYDKDWDYLGAKTRESLAPEIERITGIDVGYLTGEKHFRKACIATKMSWIAGRTTTRIEDIAYSMLGLFNIMMTPQYGEGQRAFMRLQQELLRTTTDESLFAWKMPQPDAGDRFDIEMNRETNWNSNEWGLLAPSPEWFRGCGNVTIEGGPQIQRPAHAFETSRQGLQITLMPIPAHNKYKVLMLLSPLAFIGAIPIWIYMAKKMKHVQLKGLPYTLNCWVTDKNGSMAALSVWLSIWPASGDTLAGSTGYRCKRIRADELIESYKYAKSGAEGEAVVLQPELRFGD
jgi:hypothetical protein